MASAGTARGPHDDGSGVPPQTKAAARSSSHTFLTGVFSANSSARDSNIFPDQAALSERMRFVERRDWWLWSCAVLITLLLTLAVVSFTLPSLHTRWPRFNSASASDTVLGLVG